MRALGHGKAAGSALCVGIATAISVFTVHRLLAPNDASSPFEQSVFVERRPTRLPVVPATRGEPVDEDVGQEQEVARSEGSSPAESDLASALQHASSTYASTTLVIAIREAGYICTDVVTAAPAVDDRGAWRVSCEDAMAYLVYDDGRGDLHVEPVAFIELPLFAPGPSQPELEGPLDPQRLDRAAPPPDRR